MFNILTHTHARTHTHTIALLYESKEGGKPMEGSKTQRVTTLIFSSDSEGEEFINNPSQSTQSTKRLEKLNVPMKENTEKTNKLTEEWELDEDDYCILSSPTTAKVVSYGCNYKESEYNVMFI